MQERLYLEVPTPDTAAVRTWLQSEWQPSVGEKQSAPDGIRLRFPTASGELAVVLWSLQRTTYLKLYQWGEINRALWGRVKRQLQADVAARFPLHYPELPEIDLSGQSIFTALASDYPLTARYFEKMPDGEAHLQRVYWWEKRWREYARHPQPTQAVVFETDSSHSEETSNFTVLSDRVSEEIAYDLIYIGGALGVVHAVVMARRGYRVLLVERLPFGRMNREWNISRDEFQVLIDLGLFTSEEFEGLIAREYKDGFSKFFDANNPPHLKAAVLHTPTVLNVALDAEKLLALCGEKLRAAGGEIWDKTEFVRAEVGSDRITITLQHLPTQTPRAVGGRLLIDAMGSASPIAWQLNGKRAFDSVCPTVGAAIADGFPPGVWDSNYGDVLFSHGDLSRGRQLIWELFPAAGKELTVYLFHYHQVHPDNPGSLLEMYEDFFTILPEYRRCNLDDLTWKKPTFGYIPGHFSVGSRDRVVAYDRLLALGDAASLQSPLVFTGFGSLVRNLGRLTHLLDTALQHDLLSAKDLNCIRAYQPNLAVTWLFSKGMMVPTGKTLPPERVNAMLNTFFGLLAQEPLEVADTFIKDRTDWLTFNRLALKAAMQNPALLWWIWVQAGSKDLIRWMGSYVSFTVDAIASGLLRGWFPGLVRRSRPWLEKHAPSLWLRLLSFCYALNATTGRHSEEFVERQSRVSCTLK